MDTALQGLNWLAARTLCAGLMQVEAHIQRWPVLRAAKACQPVWGGLHVCGLVQCVQGKVPQPDRKLRVWLREHHQRPLPDLLPHCAKHEQVGVYCGCAEQST